jgi:hypothetical protein
MGADVAEVALGADEVRGDDLPAADGDGRPDPVVQADERDRDADPADEEADERPEERPVAAADGLREAAQGRTSAFCTVSCRSAYARSWPAPP